MSILSFFLMLLLLYVIVKYGVKILLVLTVWAIRLFIFGLMVVFVYKLFFVSDC